MQLDDAKVVVECGTPVDAATPFTCAISAVGLGDRLAVPLLVDVRIPVGLLHVAHDAEGQFDADARTITYRLPASPNARRTFRADLIADPAAAGATLTVAATLRVDGPRRPGDVHGAGAVAVHPQTGLDLGVTVLPIAPAWIFLAMVASVPLTLGVVWLLRMGRRARARAPRRPGYPPIPKDTVMGPTLIAVVALLFFLVLAPAVVESVRSLTAFAETRCTVADRTRSGSPSGEAGDLTSQAVVRYATPAGSRIAVGFDVRGAAGGGSNASAYQAFQVGATYPCWVDPARPDRVVLRRGPSGAAWLALLPLLGVFGALGSLRAAWRQ
jgi:hypothetical protein